MEAGRANFFMSTAYIPPPLGFVLAEISCKYLRPLFFPGAEYRWRFLISWADQIQIKHRVKNVGTTSMTLEYIVVCESAVDVICI